MSMELNRRDFLKAMGCTAAAVTMPGWLRAAVAASGPRKPNIVFILFDDLGYGDPTCLNKKSKIHTANIDRIASAGVLFTDAHSAAALCSPTRYGVMTGRYPFRIGMFAAQSSWAPDAIAENRMTVASMLKQHGYHTACVGKWHLGMQLKGELKAGAEITGGPTARGFDYFVGYQSAEDIGNVVENNHILGITEPIDVQPLLAKKAVEYIAQRAKEPDKPFFLYLTLSTPHTPLVPTKEFQGKSGIGKYGDWVLEGDWVVGQMLNALEQHKLSGDTLVISSSDNGSPREASNEPLRGKKGQIWDGGHREPFVACWPGKIKPGSVCNETICLNDLMATSAEIIGYKLPDNAGEDSVSILPLLLGTGNGPVREATVHQSGSADRAIAIRQGKWKLICWKDGSKGLLDMHAALNEQKEQASDNPQVVASMTALLQRYIDNGRSTPGPRQQNDYPAGIGKGGKSNGGDEGDAEEGDEESDRAGKKAGGQKNRKNK